MRNILRNDFYNCTLLEIDDNTSLVNYLINEKRVFNSFKLNNVTSKEFDMLKECNSAEALIDFEISNSSFSIVVCTRRKGEDYRSSGGLKFQNIKDGILGSFVVEGNRVIYCPCAPHFTEERDAYVYNNIQDKYYTDISMPEIFKEVLDEKSVFLIDTGRAIKSVKPYGIFPYFIEITKEQMLECAVNPLIGKKIEEERKNSSYIVENNNQIKTNKHK